MSSPGPEQQVATPITDQGISKIYAVQHCQVAAVTADAVGSLITYGEWFDVPGIKVLELAGDMDTKELRGDNRLIDQQSIITGLTAKIEHAKVSLQVLAVMLGGSVTAKTVVAGSPYAGRGWSLTQASSPKSFGMRCISAGADNPGGAVAFVMSKCSLSGFPELGAAEEDFQTVSLEANVNPPTGTSTWLDVVIMDTYTPPAPWTPDASV